MPQFSASPAAAVRNLYPMEAIASRSSDSSGNETDLMSYTLPGGLFKRAGDQLKIRAVFTFAADADAKRVRFKVADRTVYDSDSGNINGGNLQLEILISRGTANTLAWSVIASATSVFSSAPSHSSGTIITPSAGFDGPVVIKGTGQGPAASAGDVTQRDMSITYHPFAG